MDNKELTNKEFTILLERINEIEEETDRKINIARKDFYQYMSRMHSTKNIDQNVGESKRDVSKYVFNNETYNKKRLVVAIVKYTLKTRNINTYADALELFPDKLQGSLGVIRSEKWLKENYNNKIEEMKKRFSFDDEDIIILDNSKYYICTTYDTKRGNFKRFLDYSIRKFGYEIVKESEY